MLTLRKRVRERERERQRERVQGDMTAPPNCSNFTVQTRRRANVASYK